METILEHLSKEVKQDPVLLREINLQEDGQVRVIALFSVWYASHMELIIHFQILTFKRMHFP